ncbi:MAG TPA: iron-sulfur cluster-binding protein [Clostridiales bacterium]|nr:iron-sulfur cluster-binding protein [Clostridiales bacterium]
MNKIHVIYGEDPCCMTVKLLNETAPLKGLDKNISIGIKPNLVCPSNASEGAVTHPEIVEGIIRYLKEQGFYRIKIMEGSWIGEDDTQTAFDVCGYRYLSEKYDVPLIDLKQDQFTSCSYEGYRINVCNEVLNTDYLINVPLIKGHCQTKMTCALKNMKGIIPDSEKRRFHTIGLHKPIAVLNKLVKQHLIIADAICPDPYFEEGGRPHRMNMIALGYDPVLMDVFASEILGYQKEDIPYLMMAGEMGIGSFGPYEKSEYDVQNKIVDIIDQPKEKYLHLIDESGACSACYSNLVSALKRLDEEGLTERIIENICIGQDYRDYPGEAGVGNCTIACMKNVPGCPPEQDEIYIFIKDLIRGSLD